MISHFYSETQFLTDLLISTAKSFVRAPVKKWDPLEYT